MSGFDRKFIQHRLIIIIIIIRLRSRRLQIFSTRYDIGLRRQLLLASNRCLYPPAVSECMISECRVPPSSPSAMRWGQKEHIFCITHHIDKIYWLPNVCSYFIIHKYGHSNVNGATVLWKVFKHVAITRAL